MIAENSGPKREGGKKTTVFQKSKGVRGDRTKASEAFPKREGGKK